MTWVKRNLYFLIGCTVAVALMGWTGWNLWTEWQRGDATKTKLEELYGQLANLNNQKPHPGVRNGKVDNINIAVEQRTELVEFVRKATNYFHRIAPIPADNLSARTFSAALSRLIDQMQRGATNASVILPANYSFSFAAERDKVTFAQSGLGPLSVQLGEVKAICDILFQAKINWLDNLRREPVSSDDAAGQQTDYLAQKSVTNDLAIITPYEITFRSFSSELGSVLSGFASSPYGFVVKLVNVKPASSTGETGPGPGGAPGTTYVPPPPPPPVIDRYSAPPTAPPPATIDRYGGGGGGTTPGGIAYRPLAPGAGRYGPPAAPRPTGVPPTTPQPAARSGPLQVVLDQKLLEITINLDVVKLLSNQPKPALPGARAPGRPGGSGAPAGSEAPGVPRPIARVPSDTPAPQ